MHDLDITNGQASFVSANQQAWHQLGTVLPQEKLTAEEAMKYGLLGGWNVRKAPCETTVDGKRLTVPNMNVVVRDNPVHGKVEVLGRYPVSDGFRIVQNEEHAAFLNHLVDESGAVFDTAGALDGGRQVFITMRLPGHILVGGMDKVDNYIAAFNGHDGSMSFTIMVTPVRVVCRNTMNLAFQDHSNIFRVRHTTNADKIIRAKARQALDFSFKYLGALEAEAEQLINTSMTNAQFEAIVEREFGAPEDAPASTKTRADKRLAEIFELYADASTQDGIRGTAWAGLNALTEWADHYSAVRGDDHDGSRAVKAIKDPSFKNRALQLMRAGV